MKKRPRDDGNTEKSFTIVQAPGRATKSYFRANFK